MTGRLTILVAAAAVLFSAPAHAAELKVISAGAVRGLIAQIIEDYSRQTGQKFDFTIGTTGQLRNIIASGQPAEPSETQRICSLKSGQSLPSTAFWNVGPTPPSPLLP